MPTFGGGVNRITVSHRELIGRIVGSEDWQMATRLSLNPGNSATFPWLAGMAWSWESYNWKSVRFSFEPRCGSTQVGAIQMFADYDIADVPPATESAASSYEGFMEAAPWVRSASSLNVTAMRQGKGMKYVEPPTGIPDSADPTNYSAGSFFLYTVGTGNAVSLGSLWVEYTVDLMVPTAGTGVALSLGQTASAFMLSEGTVACPAFPGPASYVCTNFADLLPAIVQSDFERPPGKFPRITYDPATGSFGLPGPGLYQLNLGQAFTTAAHVAFSARPALADLVDIASTGLSYLGDFIDPSVYQEANTYIMAGLFAVTGATGILRLAAPGPYTSWQFNVDTAGMSRIFSNFALNYVTNVFGTIGDALPFQTNVTDAKLVPSRRPHPEAKERAPIEDEDDMDEVTFPGSSPEPPPASVPSKLAAIKSAVVGRLSKRPAG